MKTIALLILMTYFSVSVQAQPIEYNDKTRHFNAWIGSPFQSSAFGTPKGFTDFKLMSPIALHLMISDVSLGWKVEKIANYNNRGVEVRSRFGLVKIRIEKAEERVLKHGYYFLSKEVNGKAFHVIAQVGGQTFCQFGLKVFYGDSNESLAQGVLQNLESYATKANPYRNSVVHSVTDEWGYRCFTHLENVYELKFKWDDLILDDKMKSNLHRDTLSFVQNYPLFQSLGLKNRKGLLFHGPPGTGKSFLGQIMIAETFHGGLKGSSSMIAVSARHLKTASDVAQLFRVTSALNPTTVFLEDIDLLGIQSRNSGSYGAAQAQAILNEFLNGLDGLVDVPGSLFIGTTNKVENVDGALSRSGRLGIHYHFGLPSYFERREFFERFSRKKAVLETGVTIEWLASESEGLTGADIVEIIGLTRQQAYQSGSWASDGVLLLKKEHFAEAIERVKNSNTDMYDGEKPKYLQSLKLLNSTL